MIHLHILTFFGHKVVNVYTKKLLNPNDLEMTLEHISLQHASLSHFLLKILWKWKIWEKHYRLQLQKNVTKKYNFFCDWKKVFKVISMSLEVLSRTFEFFKCFVSLLAICWPISLSCGHALQRYRASDKSWHTVLTRMCSR